MWCSVRSAMSSVVIIALWCALRSVPGEFEDALRRGSVQHEIEELTEVDHVRVVPSPAFVVPGVEGEGLEEIRTVGVDACQDAFLEVESFVAEGRLDFLAEQRRQFGDAG